MTKFFIDVQDRFNENRNKERLSTIRDLFNLVSDVDDADYILVLGGDGTLLSQILKYKHLNKPFFPINGGTTGYHMQHLLDKDGQASSENKKLIADFNVFVKNYPTIQVSATDIDGNVFKDYAFGDAWVERKTPRSLRFNMCIKNKNHPVYCDSSEFIDGDGILATTPAGSTGYYRIITNSTIPLGSHSFGVAPMNASMDKHKLGSFVLDEDTEITLAIKDSDFRIPRLILDGNEIEGFIPVDISLTKSDKTVQIAYLDEHLIHMKSLAFLLS